MTNTVTDENTQLSCVIAFCKDVFGNHRIAVTANLIDSNSDNLYFTQTQSRF